MSNGNGKIELEKWKVILAIIGIIIVSTATVMGAYYTVRADIDTNSEHIVVNRCEISDLKKAVSDMTKIVNELNGKIDSLIIVLQK